MSHWTELRRIAREYSQKMRAHANGEVSGTALLNAASVTTGIKCVGVPSADALLDGGDAVYDPALGRIWYNRDLDPGICLVYQAHEFAHHWLGHATRERCGQGDLDPEAPEEPVPVAIHRVQGYGPKERRERDANVFAREFLLPTDMLRRWFIDDGLNATLIAERVGVPLGMVFHQLAYAVLVGDLPRHARDSARAQEESQLDSSQRDAAYAEHGPFLVEAGPGTGKTKTLVARVLFLLHRKVDPRSILALTFSNKAAEEIRDRIAGAAPDAAPLIWIGTFHAFGLELLRKHGPKVGLSSNPPVLDPVDGMFLLERELPALDLSYYQYLPEPTKYLKHILAAISRAKDELATPADYAAFAARARAAAKSPEELEAAEKMAEVARVYAVYQACLERDGLLDFGDLIARTVHLLRHVGGVRESVRQEHPHILVDEYQDVNRASAVMLKEIAGEGAGLWIVGDARQSIYRFRGAAPINMQSFPADFPGARIVQLSRNYRSQPAVVRAISAFAAAMPSLAASPFKAWKAERRDTDGAVQMEIAENANAEIDGIAREIVQHHRDRGVSYRDQAVLCRSHTNLGRISDRLELAGIPVLYLGDLFERAEVRDLLALLSLACHGNGHGLIRVARFREYGISFQDVNELLRLAREHDRPFPRALTLATDADTISSEGRERLALLEQHLVDLSYGTEAWTMLSRYLFDRSEYVRLIARDSSLAGRQRRLAIYQFLQFAYEQRRTSHEGRRLDHGKDPKRSFLRFVRRLAMIGDDVQLRQVPDWASDIEAVRLLTVHASKGLEFPVVYVPALATGQFPARKQWDPCPPPREMVGVDRDETTQHEREEECLLFVAMSRARDVLCLSRALRYGKTKNKASPLLSRLSNVLPRPAESIDATWLGTDVSEQENGSHHPPPSPLPIYSVRSLERYLTCPRKYLYEDVLRLGARGDDTAYLEMHTCVHRVLRWMIEEAAEGRENSLADVASRLADVWREAGPIKHPYEPMYRAAAEGIVARAAQRVGSWRGRSSQPDWTLSLRHGRLTITPDSVEVMQDGGAQTVVVRRMRTGRPTKTESDRPIYGVLQEAARAEYPNASTHVEIEYLATGTTERIAAEPRSIRTRVGKFDEAMAGIHDKDFSPRRDEYNCPRCAHYFICPEANDA